MNRLQLFVGQKVSAPACSCGGALFVNGRLFSSVGRMTNEYGFGNRLKDIPTLSGSAKPVVREGDWVCEEALTETMEVAIPRILKRRGWNEVEIQREVDYFFLKKCSSHATSRLVSWRTVEDFQRTPWHRRFRTADGTVGQYISYECLKALEAALVPPSMRGDPYAHLRKRHLEEQFQSEPYSENAVKPVTREKLGAMTPGMPTYGTVTRAKFLEFDRKYKEHRTSMSTDNDSYHAWLTSLDRK